MSNIQQSCCTLAAGTFEFVYMWSMFMMVLMVVVTLVLSVLRHMVDGYVPMTCLCYVEPS